MNVQDASVLDVLVGLGLGSLIGTAEVEAEAEAWEAGRDAAACVLDGDAARALADAGDCHTQESRDHFARQAQRAEKTASRLRALTPPEAPDAE